MKNPAKYTLVWRGTASLVSSLRQCHHRGSFQRVPRPPSPYYKKCLLNCSFLHSFQSGFLISISQLYSVLGVPFSYFLVHTVNSTTKWTWVTFIRREIFVRPVFCLPSFNSNKNWSEVRLPNTVILVKWRSFFHNNAKIRCEWPFRIHRLWEKGDGEYFEVSEID